MIAKLKLEFVMDSAPFDDGRQEEEIERILRVVIDQVKSHSRGGIVYDKDGLTIGRWRILKPKENV